MNQRFSVSLALWWMAFVVLTSSTASPLFSQDSNSTSSQSSDEYLNQSINLDSGDSPPLANLSTEENSNEVRESSSSISWYLVKTVFILVVLSVGVWGLLKFLKKSGIGGASNEFMEIQSTLAVGKNQYLHIVQVGKRFYMLGVTEKNVSMLGEIEDSEMITDLRLNSEDQQESNQKSGSPSFKDLLKKFVGTDQIEFSSEEEQSTEETQLADLRNKIEEMREGGERA